MAKLACRAPRADHRRRHRHRRRGRRRISTRRAPSCRCSAAGWSRSQAVAEQHRRHRRSSATSPTATQIARAFDEARAANGPIDLLIVNAGIAESAPFHKMTRDSWDRIIAHQPHRRVRLRAGGDRRPAEERQRPAGVRRLGREPARRALCRALCRIEARPARPDAQPRRRICQDQPHRERGLPGLCRHADDRPVGRARVGDHRPQRGASRAPPSPT